MISPDTPPGTDVVCIDASPGVYGPVNLTLGWFYTVKRIEKCILPYAVVVEETPPVLVASAHYGMLQVGYR